MEEVLLPNFVWWWFIYARFIPTHTHDHSLFLLQKGAYTLTLFFSTNITRLEFRILMIRLIQFYKSRMRSKIQKKIKQITLANKPKMYLYSSIRVFFQRKDCIFVEQSFFFLNKDIWYQCALKEMKENQRKISSFP